ncbi:hypothetical protein ALC57_04948, partial [Trachymyrmex cornetzi]
LRCASHTLQLAIADVLKNKEVIDTNNRRCLTLAPKIWNKLKSIVDGLILAHIATKKLQEQHLT